MLSQVLSHNCNIGYETSRHMRLIKVNGESVLRLAHLKQFVESSQSKFLIFEFSSGQIIVMDREAALNANDQVSD